VLCVFGKIELKRLGIFNNFVTDLFNCRKISSLHDLRMGDLTVDYGSENQVHIVCDFEDTHIEFDAFESLRFVVDCTHGLEVLVDWIT
jgi:DNA transposition AAA+ family ATPase